MLIILGYLVIILAAVLQAYCEFGRQARPDIQPKILRTRFRFVMEGLWIFLLIIASVALFLNGWVPALIGIVAFWLVLPFLITPILRNRVLPPWDEVKAELEPKGYNQRDYWRGDWWMEESKQKRRKRQKM